MSREIDAMVAEKVMGWTADEMGCWSTETHPSHGGRVRWCKPDSEALDCLNDAEVWDPARDPAAAMQVVNHMSNSTKEHWEIAVHSCACVVVFRFEGGRDRPWKPGSYVAEGCGVEDIPKCISLAALRAVGGEGGKA